MNSPGLPDDWHNPLRDLQAQAWAMLEPSERERLKKLQRERGADGLPVWEPRVDTDPDDPTWRILSLRSTDAQPDEVVGGWALKWETEPVKDAEAIRDEHHTD